MSDLPIGVKVDGKGLNASHFAAMSEDEAVKAMKEDGISDDPTWAKKAYKSCKDQVKAVTELRKKKREEAEAEENKRKAAQQALKN